MCTAHVYKWGGLKPLSYNKILFLKKVAGAAREDRTLDLSLTKGVLYH